MSADKLRKEALALPLDERAALALLAEAEAELDNAATGYDDLHIDNWRTS